MWWGGCEFRGREAVQRGKYPGFRGDSEEARVALGSSSCRRRVMGTQKNLARHAPCVVTLTRVGARQEGKFGCRDRRQRDAAQAAREKAPWRRSEPRLARLVPPPAPAF